MSTVRCREFFRQIFTPDLCAEAASKLILQYFMHRKVYRKREYVLRVEQWILINFNCTFWENKHLENQQVTAKVKILVLVCSS